MVRMGLCRLGGIFGLLAIVVALNCGCNRGAPTASIGGESPAGAVGANSDEPMVTHPVRLTADNHATISPARAQPLPEVLIQTSMGDLRVRLNSAKAPVTVGAFLSNYVARKFYDDTIFHYVDKSSMIIGGSFSEDLERREPDAPIRSEAHNGLLNRRGTIAMTRDRDNAHSANSEFFFNLIDSPALDHQSRESDAEYGYCVFGEIIEGLDVLDRIANCEVHTQGEFENLPKQPVVIVSIQQVQ